MCIGIPMQVIETAPGRARCQGKHEQRWVNMAIVGGQAVGTWLLVFHDAAREVIDEQVATQIGDALQAVELAMQGEDIDHLFADLVNREPELPEHLQSGLKAKA
jgi:hydrogenase expression/formation protein HypC